jgi:hypothetical protein
MVGIWHHGCCCGAEGCDTGCGLSNCSITYPETQMWCYDPPHNPGGYGACPGYPWTYDYDCDDELDLGTVSRWRTKTLSFSCDIGTVSIPASCAPADYSSTEVHRLAVFVEPPIWTSHTREGGGIRAVDFTATPNMDCYAVVAPQVPWSGIDDNFWIWIDGTLRYLRRLGSTPVCDTMNCSSFDSDGGHVSGLLGSSTGLRITVAAENSSPVDRQGMNVYIYLFAQTPKPANWTTAFKLTITDHLA